MLGHADGDSATTRRAVVCGGGGLAGHSWLVGMITGLEDSGFDWGTVDLVVGTSCGAVVGAQLAAGRPPSEIRDRYSKSARASDLPEFTPAEGAALGRVMNGGDEQEAIRGMGREALAATTARSTEALRANVLEQVGDENWPARRFVTTAVDIDHGTFHELAAESGLSMIDAVVASCSLPFLFTPAVLGGRRYADGFLRSPANVDCARGYDRVLVLSPMNLGFSPRGAVTAQAEQLRHAGSAVAVAIESEAITELCAGRRMDPAHVDPVIELAHAQAAARAAELIDFWR